MDLVPIWYKDKYCPPPSHTYPGHVKNKVTDLEFSRNKVCNIRRAILSGDRSCFSLPVQSLKQKRGTCIVVSLVSPFPFPFMLHCVLVFEWSAVLTFDHEVPCASPTRVEFNLWLYSAYCTVPLIIIPSLSWYGLMYRIRSNYRTYPYKRTLLKFLVFRLHTASVHFIYFLAHLSKSSGWAIVITLCPSSVVNN